MCLFTCGVFLSVAQTLKKTCVRASRKGLASHLHPPPCPAACRTQATTALSLLLTTVFMLPYMRVVRMAACGVGLLVVYATLQVCWQLTVWVSPAADCVMTQLATLHVPPKELLFHVVKYGGREYAHLRSLHYQLCCVGRL